MPIPPNVVINLDDSDIARFRRLAGETAPDGCRYWTARLNGNGYGVFKLRGQQPVLAHRVSWVIANGRQIPQGQLIRHACDHPACTQPSHLLTGSYRDNARDAVVRGRYNNGRRNRTHCPRGHAYVAPNLVVAHAARGERACRSCAYAFSRRSYAKKKGRPFTDADFVAKAAERYSVLMASEVSR